jgi:hypothetical protein
MAYHRKHRRHRRNFGGLSGGVIKDAAWVAGGAIAAAALPGMVAPSFSTGWTGVIAKGAAAVAASFVGKMVGGPTAAAEALKGGLAITLLAALKQGGVAIPGLGLYAPSTFYVPTASSQHLVASDPRGTYNRGSGTIVLPGPQGPVLVAAPGASGTTGRLGYHRFRSRYQGGYG